MPKTWRKIESELQPLVEILLDSQEGLVTVGERLKDSTLKRYFFAESLKRAQFIEELKELFKQLGLAKIRASGSTVGTLHRVWARIKSKFNDSDLSLLITAEQGEFAIAEFYENIMRARLPVCVRSLLVAQARHIHMAHSYVKIARDRVSTGTRKLPAQKSPIEG